MSALNLITAELTSTLELSAVLTTLEQQLAEHLNILGGAVYLLGITGLELYTAWGIPTDLIAHTSRLMLSGRFSPDNLRVNPHLLDSLFAGSAEEDPQWQSTVAIPLICNHQSWGYLVLYDAEPLAFGKHRPAFFEMLGHQLGAALQNARMFRTVVEGREELRHLTHRLVAAQEAEQARLARELHDEFGQILTCMKLTLEMVEQAGIAPDAVAHLAQARSLADDMLAHVRHMTFELRTTVLDDLGLMAALQWYTDRFTSQTGIDIRLTQRGFEPGQRFPEPVEIAAYRIVQETLTNVARHADTEEASITLSIPNTAVHSPLRMVIEDFGQGFDIHQRRLNTSNGLTGMRERAAALGGTVVVNSSPGQGTRVEVLLPVENEP
jgi:signal transduction histidine kinase